MWAYFLLLEYLCSRLEQDLREREKVSELKKRERERKKIAKQNERERECMLQKEGQRERKGRDRMRGESGMPLKKWPRAKAFYRHVFS